jgi:hypothetical protein
MWKRRIQIFMKDDEAIIIKKMDENMETVYEYWDSKGSMVVMNSSYEIIDNRVWISSSSTYQTPFITFGTSTFGYDIDYRTCLVCSKPHYWIWQGQQPDHPCITDNLDYVEYLAKQKGLI